MTIFRFFSAVVVAMILSTAPVIAVSSASGATELPRPHLFDEDRRTGSGAAPLPADPAMQRLLKGLRYLEGGQSDFAVLELDEAIKLKPDYAEALFYRARAHYDGGHFQQAIDDYLRVTSLMSLSDRAFYNLGLCYWQIDDLSAAQRAFTQSLLFNADQPDALRARGRIAQRQDDPEAAIEDYTAAIKLDPDDGATYYYRGVAYLAYGEAATALEDLNQALRLDPDLTWAVLARANAYYELQRPEDAEREYTAALRLHPDAEIALVRRAHVYEMTRQFDLGLADVNRALELDPNNLNALFGRAALSMGQGNFIAVISDLDIVLRKLPEHSTSLLRRGQAQAMLGRDKEAQESFSAAVRARPDEGESYNGRGVMRMILGDLAPAITDLKLAVQIIPDAIYPAIWHHLARSKAAGAIDKESLDRLQRHKSGPWPAPIAAYLLGELSAEELLVQARKAQQYDIPAHLSDAYYVIGERFLLSDVDEARQAFTRARDARAYNQYAHLAAIRALQRLEAR
jgi:tetratricopeptide (TPR) repeat protein